MIEFNFDTFGITQIISGLLIIFLFAFLPLWWTVKTFIKACYNWYIIDIFFKFKNLSIDQLSDFLENKKKIRAYFGSTKGHSIIVTFFVEV